jgi:uncharacterized membrane protein
MKYFFRILILIIAGIILYTILALVAGTNYYLLGIVRVLIGAGIIIGGLLILRKNKRWSHRLPKDKEREHEENYKNQFKKD